MRRENHDRRSPSDAKITSNNPFLAIDHLTTLMQHAVGTMAVQQCKAHFKTYNEGLWRRLFALLSGWIGVEDGLTSDTTCCWRSEIKQKRPSCAGKDWQRPR